MSIVWEQQKISMAFASVSNSKKPAKRREELEKAMVESVKKWGGLD